MQIAPRCMWKIINYLGRKHLANGCKYIVSHKAANSTSSVTKACFISKHLPKLLEKEPCPVMDNVRSLDAAACWTEQLAWLYSLVNAQLSAAVWGSAASHLFTPHTPLWFVMKAHPVSTGQSCPDVYGIMWQVSVWASRSSTDTFAPHSRKQQPPPDYRELNIFKYKILLKPSL